MYDEAGTPRGPPRVWDRLANHPGLCMTRSLGDTLGKRLGVTATPETLRYELTPDDRCVACQTPQQPHKCRPTWPGVAEAAIVLRGSAVVQRQVRRGRRALHSPLSICR